MEPLDSSFQRTAELIIERPPDAFFLLALLATMNPNHEIFRKDYVKPRAVRSAVNDSDYVDNPDDFFTGLPALGRTTKRRGHMRFNNQENSSVASNASNAGVVSQQLSQQLS